MNGKMEVISDQSGKANSPRRNIERSAGAMEWWQGGKQGSGEHDYDQEAERTSGALRSEGTKLENGEKERDDTRFLQRNLLKLHFITLPYMVLNIFYFERRGKWDEKALRGGLTDDYPKRAIKASQAWSNLIKVKSGKEGRPGEGRMGRTDWTNLNWKRGNNIPNSLAGGPRSDSEGKSLSLCNQV